MNINCGKPCIGFHNQFLPRDLLKRGNADELQDFIQRGRKVLSLLGNSDKQAGAQDRPDLDPDAVGRCAEESALAQMLHEPAPEQLGAPTTLGDLSDEQGRQGELVGEENQALAVFRIHVTDSPQPLGIGLLALAGVEPDGLVATQAGGLVDCSRFCDIETDADLQAREEEGSGEMKRIQAQKVEISTIEYVLGSWIYRNLVEGCHLVPVSLVQTGEYRNVVPQIEQHLQLDRGLIALPPGPREQRQTQLDQRRIQGEQVRLQAQFVRSIGVQATCPTHQHRRHFGEYPLGPMIVGIGHVGPRDPASNTHMIGALRAQPQTRLGAAQPLAMSQPSEDHRRKVIVGCQRSRRSWHRKLRGGTRQFLRVETGENLGEDRGRMIHTPPTMTQKRDS